MLFKKKKIKTSRSIIPLIWGIIAWVWVFFLWFFIVWAAQKLHFEIFTFDVGKNIEISEFLPSDSSKAQITQEKDKSIHYILLIWKWWWTHDAPDLTDTMILAGINSQSQSITLLSIPRDLWVEYPVWNEKWKINGIYESNLYLGEKIAIKRLQSKITEITGKNIDSYMMVDFQWFIEVVDALWGVEVTLENNFVDYEYPDGNLGYKTFILRKWTWTLDGEVALMYARSRHSTSDFDRSLRQQEILSSIKNKVSNLGYLKDSKKILSLYNIFSEYVETNLKISDMLSLWLELKSWENTKFLSYNLNDTCYSWSPDCQAGGLLYVPLREYFWGASVLLPNIWNSINPSQYQEIQTFSKYIFNSPEVFIQQSKIMIYNGSWIPLLALSLADTLRPYWFTFQNENDLQTLRGEKIFENSVLQYNTNSDVAEVVEILEDFLNIEVRNIDTNELLDSSADIEIILMDEYDS